MEKTIGVILLLALAGWFVWSRAAIAAELELGKAAPGFSLMDQNSETRQLADYRGRWVVLYFYPKDDTPGCTKEACAFRDGYAELKQLDAEVLGVSLDNTESHAEFADKYHLPFPLLADQRGEVARAYGVLWKIGPLAFAKRQTFIINPEGKLARHYPKVNAETHAGEVLADLKALQQGGQ